MKSKTMRLFEIVDPEISKLKSKIMRAMDKLDFSNPENEKLLYDLKTVLNRSNISSALSSSGMKDRISNYQQKMLKSGKPSQSKDEQVKKQKAEALWRWFEKELRGLEGIPDQDRINFMVHLKQGHGIDPKIFKEPGNGNILDKINPKLRKTETFQAIKEIMWEKKKAGQGGMGPGELFIIALTSGAKKGGGANDPDIVIDGTYKIELKLGGIVPPGKGGSNNIIDRLNIDLINNATKDGIIGNLGKIGYVDSTASGKKTKAPGGVSVENGWFPELFKQYKQIDPQKAETLFNNYFNNLYSGKISKETIKSLYKKLGTPGAGRTLAPEVFREYQKDKDFDSLCVVDNNFNYVTMTKEQIKSKGFEVPSEVGLTLKLIKGGDTNAVKDGHYVIAIGKDPIVPDTEPESLDDLDINPEVEQPKKPSKKSTQKDLFTEPEDDLAQKQELASADDQFVQKLQDPNNPLTQAWRNYTGDRVAAKDELLSLIMAGKSDQELAQDLESTVYESELRRMRQLIG
jgi:hypothetical protein